MLQSASADSKTANARRSSGSVRSTATVPITPIAAPSNHAMLRLQRKCECGGQPGCDCDSTRDKEKHGGSLHRMPAAGPAPAAPAHNPTPRPGQTLDPATQAFFETRFQPARDGQAGQRNSHSTLRIGPVDDPLEREADSVADRVMGRITPSGVGGLQRAALTPGGAGERAVAPASVHRTLASPGAPLDGASRAFFEPRFGRDFSGVRIHTHQHAADSARAVGARAFTVGNHIVFGSGEYQPGRDSGRKLMAHELAHVVQQQQADGAPLQRACKSGAYCKNPATLGTFVPDTESKPENVAKAAKRKAACTKVPPDPTCTSDGHGAPATALTALLRANYSSRVSSITGIFVDKDIPADYAAVTQSCGSFMPPLPGATCTFVPDVLEAQAKQYNSGSRTIGGELA